MPELPEVETTMRALAPYLLGQTLQQVTIRAPMLRQPTPPASLLQGRLVQTLARRAKYILAGLDDGFTLLIHLGMSGRFSIVLPDASVSSATALSQYPYPPLAKHDHAVFQTSHAELRFNDPRRFGLLLRLPTATLAHHSLLAHLGPEPLMAAFTGPVLHKALRAIKGPIKPALMDNKVVVGVGNIYASESLFAAGILPQQPAHTLTKAQCTRLVASIVQTLQKALQAGGSTLRDYRQITGEAGHFQDNFRVYNRKGLPCLVCQTPIQSITMAQRSTYWCPLCQGPHQCR